MSDVDDLVAFVRQQLDAKELEAQAFLARTGTSLLGQRLYREQLAEVEAKRRVLDEFERRWHAEDPNYDVRRTDDNWGDALAFVVKALAQPYAGREGWDARWALG